MKTLFLMIQEFVYDLTYAMLKPLSGLLKANSPFEKIMIALEKLSKGVLYDCQMCGQCILHSTGMVCSMNCPKTLRNGPCGGVRLNGHCEVKPEIRCVWVRAYENSTRLPKYGCEIMWIQPPVNRALKNTSAWINMLQGSDQQDAVLWQTEQEKQRLERGWRS